MMYCNGEMPRDWLIAALGVAMTDVQARAVVDALDAYLEEGPYRPVLTFENLTPDYPNEMAKIRAERDAAVRFAEQALEQMQATLKTLKEKNG